MSSVYRCVIYMHGSLFSKISTKRAYHDQILLASDFIKFGFNCALIKDDMMFNFAKSKSEKVPLK